MASLTFHHVHKKYGSEHYALKDFHLEVKDKEFLVIVGPSGCGKSTALRMTAGLEKLTEGELYLGDELMNDVHPKDRDIAMVFQNYTLYPHMTVFDNMAFVSASVCSAKHAALRSWPPDCFGPLGVVNERIAIMLVALIDDIVSSPLQLIHRVFFMPFQQDVHFAVVRIRAVVRPVVHFKVGISVIAFITDGHIKSHSGDIAFHAGCSVPMNPRHNNFRGHRDTPHRLRQSQGSPGQSSLVRCSA